MPVSSAGKDATALRQRRSESTSTTATKIPVRLPLSKQDRLLRDMAAQNEAEFEERAVLERYQNQAYASSMRGYMRSLFLLAVVGIIGFGYVMYAYPTLIFPQKSARLVDRRIMTIYPAALHIKRDLPRFFDSYAIVTPDNLPARRAVRQVAAIRRIVIDSGRFNQKLKLQAWEHEDFTRQLPGQALDSFCSAGFKNQYRFQQKQQQDQVEASIDVDDRTRLDDLMYWCLMQSGQHDGFVRWNVTVEASLTRGMQGVAGVSTDTVTGEGKVRPSFLFLPIRAPKKDDQDVGLSTEVPFKIMKWLLDPANFQYTQEDYEKVLYMFIKEEADRWVLLNVACTVSERGIFDTTKRRVVSECHDSSDNDDEETCCSIYDPQLRPYLPRVHHDDDEDADVERRKRLRLQREKVIR
jgi:hypothetical protein